jgi:hypothetical protein
MALLAGLFHKAFTSSFPSDSTPRTYPFPLTNHLQIFSGKSTFPEPTFPLLTFPIPFHPLISLSLPQKLLLGVLLVDGTMSPWNQPRPHHLSWKEILQMEMEKTANEATEEMMNQVKEMLEENSYEERFQEDPDEAYHVEDSKEAFNEYDVLSLNDPYEEIQSDIHPTHQEENTMIYYSFEDTDENMFHDPRSEGALEEPSDTDDQHIDTFIQIGKCGWEMELFHL